jgi:hypothetical protein
MMPLSLYRADLDVLRSGKVPVVVGIGEESVGQSIEGMGKALANKLGSESLFFPGDHFGFEAQAETFAQTLHQAFSNK